MRPPKPARRTFITVDHNSPNWAEQQRKLDEQRRRGHNEAQGRYRKKRAKRLLTVAEEPIRFEAGPPPADKGWTISSRAKIPGKFRTYNMTVNAIFALHRSQNGKCAICLVEIRPLGRTRAVDHCHATGTIRGMLCKNCNLGLGHFRDDPRRLIAALAYLGFIDKKFLTMEYHINSAFGFPTDQTKESI